LIVAAAVVACHTGAGGPRSFEFFMEDGLAREGALARCNLDRDATADDVECMNARRAAASVAAGEQQSRSGELAAQSERKLEALRDRDAREAQAEKDAAEAAKAAEREAYEAQWRDQKGASNARIFGEVESLSQVPTRPELELAAVTPPASDIAQPELEIEQSAIIPRPFRTDEILSR
jgi:hypothetical protein